MEKQEHGKISKIDDLIKQLPQNFPEAAVVIKKDIIPLLVDCDKGIIDHYCTLVKKHTRAASKSAVTKLVNETIRELQTAGYRNDIHVEEPSEADSNTPEIIETAKRIAQDPQLLRNKIDTVNELGVAGERKNIGLNLITIDSRLLPISGGKPENLGLKNSGHQGSGKSNQLTKSLKIYPETAYHILSSVTPKGLMMMSDMLKHKAVVFSEAKSFEAAKRDTHQAYIVRSLLSEGFFEEPRQTMMDQGWATETLRIQGPISLVTTTIKGKLEQQLEDRILTAHSDTSSDQTRRVLEQTAATASGIENSVDDSLVKAWQQFHDMLEPAEVVIPYATELIQYLPNHPLPVSARRAFVRVLSAIKTITILYQAQRNRDDRGRLIAEYADYAMAYQLIGDCFANSVKDRTAITDERINIIKAAGMITPGALAKTAGVSKPAISQWLESRVNEGLVACCNEKGLEFDDISALGKAKNCGEAYVRLISFNFLPTPYRLTGNPRWDKGGDLFNLYYLWLEEDGPVQGINARVCEPAEVLSETRRDRASISDAEGMKQQEHPGGLIPFTKDMLDSLMDEFGPLAS